MSYTCFDVSVADHIGHVRLNRPEKRNSMVLEFWHELPQALTELDASGEVRAVVLSSTGPHFTAGIDLGSFASLLAGQGAAANAGLAFMDTLERMQGAFTALETLRVPVIAAIQGGCIGGGVDLVCAADLRLCTRDAYFTIYEIEIGMTADVGTFPRILNHLPEGIVRELAYTGRRMPADEALQRGLVNAVHEGADAVLDAAMALAGTIATKAPLAIHGTKQAITYARDHSTNETLRWLQLWNASMLKQSEVMSAMAESRGQTAGAFASLPARPKT